MLDLIIHKHPDSEEVPVFLTLPASRWDVLEAKARLGMDNLNEGFYEYEMPSDVPQLGSVLKTMWRGQNFVEELNYFAQRLSEMSHSDRILLNGAIAIHCPEDMKTLINLTHHNLDSIVMAEASTDAELGRFLVDNDFVEFSEEVIPYLDFAKIGAEHRANHSCAFDRNLFYEDLNPQINEVYDGHTLPEIPNTGYVFDVSIRNPEHDPDDARLVDLDLPASFVHIHDVLAQAGLDDIDDAEITGFHSNIKLLERMTIPQARLRSLNDFAADIAAMDDGRYIKFLAILEHEGFPEWRSGADHETVLDSLLYLAEYMDHYNFTPGIRPEEIGSYGLVRLPPQQEQAMTQAEPEMEMGGI